MIFITLGTQDKPFVRLLDAVQKQIDKGNIKEDVIVQAGYTKYESDDMNIFEFIDFDSFDSYIKNCDVLITHGGVGNILTALLNNKKVIAAARLSEFGEHTNDHQLQLVDKFADEGYLLKLDDFDGLDVLLDKIKNFKPKKYVSNTKHFCNCLREEIAKL